MCAHDLAQERQHELAVLRELHALFAAKEQRKAELLFECADHACDTRLRVAQKLRRSRQAPLLGRSQKRFTFDCFHFRLLSMI